MAITKIRKFSSWTLTIVAVISIAIILAFFFGGQDEPVMRNGEALKNPKFTGLLMYWAYFLFLITAVSLILFGIVQFLGKFKTNPKAALMSLGIWVAFIVLLVVTYSIGDTTPIPNINVDSQKYNIASWLKISDMWLYTIYVMLTLSIIAMIWGSVKKVISK